MCELMTMFYCIFLDYGQAEIDPMNLPMGPVFVVQPHNTIYHLGSTLKLVHFMCEAAARPLPTYIWYVTHDQRRGEVDLSDGSKTVTNGRLTIEEPSETEDNGDYQCLAQNERGKILSDWASLSFGCKIYVNFNKAYKHRD